MTRYCVEFITGGVRKVETFDSAVARALFIISFSPYIDFVRTFEVAS